eukprot:CAMPEP_0197030996 /NCGR_PEP_ID=MMETSP1384-20130603/10113_1 /TAXON_ID=29189 /ORGANISM="Ammonia sp." /LENGTH=85 /DNA_ID=CAMNT_0042460451 /DNA_START=219 /DNA_END=476 /DNA_ORIENTATION=-
MVVAVNAARAAMIAAISAGTVVAMTVIVTEVIAIAVLTKTSIALTHAVVTALYARVIAIMADAAIYATMTVAVAVPMTETQWNYT